jgi:hypothetical protein
MRHAHMSLARRLADLYLRAVQLLSFGTRLQDQSLNSNQNEDTITTHAVSCFVEEDDNEAGTILSERNAQAYSPLECTLMPK